MGKGRSQGNATISNIILENITMVGGQRGIQVDMTYETSGSKVPNTGCTVQHAAFKHVTAEHLSSTVGVIKCLKDRPCQDLVLDDVHLSSFTPNWDCSYADFAQVTGVTPSPLKVTEGHATRSIGRVCVEFWSLANICAIACARACAPHPGFQVVVQMA